MKKKKRMTAALLTLLLLTGHIQNEWIFAQEPQSEWASETEKEPESIVFPEEVESETTKNTEEAPTQESATEQSDTESWTELPDDMETEASLIEMEEEISEAETEPATESKTEDSEAETEKAETESELDTGDIDYGIDLMAMTKTPSGVPVSSASGWTKVTTKTKFSSDYRPVKFYSGISSMELFNNSTGVVKNVVTGTTSDGQKYLYPWVGGQGGKFGAIYHKVLYYNHKWYDLKMTVVGYTNQINCDGGGKVDSRPFIQMMPTAIEWKFNQALGGLVLKCEFLENESGKKTAVNTRFQWWDVDGAQRFGLKVENGSVAGKYYYANSPVYIQSGQTVAGTSGLEMAIGQGADTSATNPLYCVTYELKNCSGYYMAIGPRDHIDQDDYSYGKSHIESMNADLTIGVGISAKENQELKQTDSSLSILDTPAPEKSVSNDGKTWSKANTLAKVSNTYWYQMNQFIPWQDSTAQYQLFAIQDQLPQGVSYVGNLSVIREEDGKNMTGSFTSDIKGQTVKVSAGSALLGSGNFYGYHFIVKFQAKLNPSALTPSYSGNTASYSVKNTVSAIYRHKSESSDTIKKSGEVTTAASVTRKEQETPVKYLDQDIKKTEKILKMRNEEILCQVQQLLPENELAFMPSEIVMTDQLEKCLEPGTVNVQIQKKGSSAFEVISDADIQIQGSTIRVQIPFRTEYNGAVVRYQIQCTLKEEYDLSSWTQTMNDGSVWIQVPNEAAITVTWTKGTPLSVTKKTGKVLVKLRINHIRLTKEINGEDIVWAHGNPTFIFSLKGEDAGGNPHIYYQAVEFRKDATATAGTVSLTADFQVPAGTYEAAEEKTMRYQLKDITGITNGTLLEDHVRFVLDGNCDGAAVFRNEKVTDQKESHTDLVKNVIKK